LFSSLPKHLLLSKPISSSLFPISFKFELCSLAKLSIFHHNMGSFGDDFRCSPGGQRVRKLCRKTFKEFQRIKETTETTDRQDRLSKICERVDFKTMLTLSQVPDFSV
jgi:hypothetical protein